MQGLAELEHDVVGDIDGERDRPHAGQDQPPPQPGRRSGGRVEPGDDPGDIALAALVIEPHLRAAAGRRHLEHARVDHGEVEGRRGLPGDAADRQRVAAVGRDGDVEHLVAQLEQQRHVGAQRAVRRQHEDAGRGLGQPQLGLAADHPVGGVPVGLPGRDLEAAREQRPGQRKRHPVAGPEVGRAADHLVDPLADIDVAVTDRLVVAGQFLDVEHLADDDALDVVADPVDLLDLEPGPQQRRGERVGAGGQAGDMRP